MKIELIVVGFERKKEIEDLFEGFLRPRVGAIDLVDDDDRLEPELQRLGQHEFGLRHDGFGGIDEEDHAIHHREDALDLAAEIGMARRIHDVDPRARSTRRWCTWRGW